MAKNIKTDISHLNLKHNDYFIKVLFIYFTLQMQLIQYTVCETFNESVVNAVKDGRSEHYSTLSKLQCVECPPSGHYISIKMV